MRRKRAKRGQAGCLPRRFPGNDPLAGVPGPRKVEGTFFCPVRFCCSWQRLPEPNAGENRAGCDLGDRRNGNIDRAVRLVYLDAINSEKGIDRTVGAPARP